MRRALVAVLDWLWRVLGPLWGVDPGPDYEDEP